MADNMQNIQPQAITRLHEKLDLLKQSANKKINILKIFI